MLKKKCLKVENVNDNEDAEVVIMCEKAKENDENRERRKGKREGKFEKICLHFAGMIFLGYLYPSQVYHFCYLGRNRRAFLNFEQNLGSRIIIFLKQKILKNSGIFVFAKIMSRICD